NREDPRIPVVVRTALELHTDLQLGRKKLAALHSDQLRIVVSESIVGLQSHVARETLLFTFLSLFHEREDAFRATMQVADGLLGSFDHFSVSSGQLISQ